MADPSREEIWRRAAEARRRQSEDRRNNPEGAAPPARQQTEVERLLEIPAEPERESSFDWSALFTNAEALLAFFYAAVFMGPAARWLVLVTMGPGPKELSFAGMIFIIGGFVLALFAMAPVLLIQQKVLGTNYLARIGFDVLLVVLLIAIAGPVNRWEPKAPRDVTEEERPVDPATVRALEERERLLSEGPGPHYQSSAVHDAAQAGDMARLETLLSQGLALDAPGRNGRTPLMLAVEAKRLEVVRFLLERGAAVNARDMEGATALFFADRNRELIELLAANGADPNPTRAGLGIWWNLRYAYDETIMAIADRFPSIGLPVDSEGRRWAGPLHQQAEAANAVLVKYFLGRGLGANEADWRGMTPVHSAVHQLGGDAVKTIAVLELLLAAGGDVNARDGSGRTALMMTGDVPEVVSYLVEHGADVNALMPWEKGHKSVLDLYEYWGQTGGAGIVRAAGGKTAAELPAARRPNG